MSFASEFREFAIKGNVIDLAVGVIIGGAFGKIVGSAIDDLIMPLVGRLIGNVDFSNLFVALAAVPGVLCARRFRKSIAGKLHRHAFQHGNAVGGAPGFRRGIAGQHEFHRPGPAMPIQIGINAVGIGVEHALRFG